LLHYRATGDPGGPYRSLRQNTDQLFITFCAKNAFTKPGVLEKTADFRKKLHVRATPVSRRKGHHKNLRRFVIKTLKINFSFAYSYARHELTYRVGPGMGNRNAVLHPGRHPRFMLQDVLQGRLGIEDFPGRRDEFQQRSDDLLLVSARKIGCNQFDRECFPDHANTIGWPTGAVKFIGTTGRIGRRRHPIE
jgi:hypothetical protein